MFYIKKLSAKQSRCYLCKVQSPGATVLLTHESNTEFILIQIPGLSSFASCILNPMLSYDYSRKHQLKIPEVNKYSDALTL